MVVYKKECHRLIPDSRNSPRFTMRMNLAVLVLAVVVVGPRPVPISAQSTNYLLEAYDFAMRTAILYKSDANFFREMLTFEIKDLSYYAIDIMANLYELTESAEHGAGVQQCVEIAANSSLTNFHVYEDKLREFDKDTREIHLSVFKALMEVNIMEEGGYAVFYEHLQSIEEMLAQLSFHFNRMNDAQRDDPI